MYITDDFYARVCVVNMTHFSIYIIAAIMNFAYGSQSVIFYIFINS